MLSRLSSERRGRDASVESTTGSCVSGCGSSRFTTRLVSLVSALTAANVSAVICAPFSRAASGQRHVFNKNVTDPFHIRIQNALSAFLPGSQKQIAPSL